MVVVGLEFGYGNVSIWGCDGHFPFLVYLQCSDGANVRLDEEDSYRSAYWSVLDEGRGWVIVKM